MVHNRWTPRCPRIGTKGLIIRGTRPPPVLPLGRQSYLWDASPTFGSACALLVSTSPAASARTTTLCWSDHGIKPSAGFTARTAASRLAHELADRVRSRTRHCAALPAGQHLRRHDREVLNGTPIAAYRDVEQLPGCVAHHKVPRRVTGRSAGCYAAVNIDPITARLVRDHRWRRLLFASFDRAHRPPTDGKPVTIRIQQQTPTTTKIQFVLPDEIHEGAVSAVGSFNDWQPGVHRLVRRSNGTRSVTVSVPSGQEIRFRYLGDGGIWFDDPDADEITEEGSLVRT
jgi:hypothetical protein